MDGCLLEDTAKVDEDVEARGDRRDVALRAGRRLAVRGAVRGDGGGQRSGEPGLALREFTTERDSGCLFSNNQPTYPSFLPIFANYLFLLEGAPARARCYKKHVKFLENVMCLSSRLERKRKKTRTKHVLCT